MESLPVEMRRMIMDHLTNAELLTISRVNKLLNFEARTLLRDRANLIARVGCRDVLPFLSHLEGMNVVPFTGITVSWPVRPHHALCPPPRKILDPNVLDVLHRMPLKSLSLELYVAQYKVKKCPVIQLVTKILQDYSGVLEKLEVNGGEKLLEFIQEIIQDSTFPRLKVIQICKWPCGHRFRDWERRCFIRDIKARAPNLQELKEDVLGRG